MAHKGKKHKKSKSEVSKRDEDRAGRGTGGPLFGDLTGGLTGPVDQLTGGLLGGGLLGGARPGKAKPKDAKSGSEKPRDDESRDEKSTRSGGRGTGIPVLDQLLSGSPLGDAVNQLTSVAKPILEPIGEVAEVATTPLQEGADALGLGGLLDGGLLGGGVLGSIGAAPRASASGLRKRGTALIRLSQQPNQAFRDLHPSFGHIVDQLLPDEARILRFMGKAGTQPLIDVRTKTLFMIGSELLLGGLSMVAEMAGCERPEQDRSYFANLHRLGLLEVSDEPVEDYRRYALLEVQPPAVHAIESVKKAHTIFRSIRLTAFGRQFIDMAFDLDEYNAGGWADDGRNDKYIGKRGPHGKKLAKSGEESGDKELVEAG